MSDASSDRPDRGPTLFERLRGLLGMPQASARDDIEEAIAESSESGELSLQERSMLTNVLGLHDVRVADIMVPRSDVVSVKIDATLGDVLALFRTAGHSRFPVHGDTLDDPRGMVHIRDFLDHIAGAALARRQRRTLEMTHQGQPAQRLVGSLDLSTPLEQAEILRQPLFVPPSMPVLDLLRRMQQTHVHMALVIDEYGGVDGLVSLEDVVEVIVGDIADEHDEDEAPVVAAQEDGSFLVDARATLEEVEEATGLKLSDHDDADDVDTLGGLVATLAGRVPAVGESVAGPDGATFEVVEADPRRVKRLRLRLAGPPPVRPDAGA